jgi:hypothetical protein
VGDTKGGTRSARAGTRPGNGKDGIRRRAVGTRDRIISYLGSVSDITDPSGMASTKLAEAVGYPGSSVAFAQLLSGMERDGLIMREVRGKRTYRIILAPGVQPGRAKAGDAVGGPTAQAAEARVVAGSAMPAVIGLPSPTVPAFDYDELARRLLIQVVRRLASPPEGQEGVVADLERELVVARGRASSLTAENRKLREQLRQVQSSLDAARRSLDTDDIDSGADKMLNGTGPVADELSDAEVVLLERLVSPARDATRDEDSIESDATASLGARAAGRLTRRGLRWAQVTTPGALSATCAVSCPDGETSRQRRSVHPRR